MEKIKEEETKVKKITAEDYLRASLRAVERILQRPKYTNTKLDTEEQGIHDCLGWMRGSLMIALNLREYEKKEPEKEGITAEQDLKVSIQVLENMMQKQEYSNAKFGTEEHGFRECLGWMRATFKIAVELMEAEKEEKEREIESEEEDA